MLSAMAVCTAGIAQAARWKYASWLAITLRLHLSPDAKNHVSASTTYQMNATIPKNYRTPKMTAQSVLGTLCDDDLHVVILWLLSLLTYKQANACDSGPDGEPDNI